MSFAAEPRTLSFLLLTADYTLPLKNSLRPAPASIPGFPAPLAYSPPATSSKLRLPRRTSAVPRWCSAPRYKHGSPGKYPRCHSSSKAARSESFLRSLGLTLTVEALAKRVNSSNLALCPPFTALPIRPRAPRRLNSSRATFPTLGRASSHLITLSPRGEETFPRAHTS